MIFKEDYVPTHEDVLKTRIRTTGMIETKYEINDVFFNIYDVGGARNERKKWIHSFENVAAVIYFVSLNHYNATLFEDESKNAMHESIQLFDELVNSKWFKRTDFILILNKRDLFEELLSNQVSLSNCFSHKYGWNGEQWDEKNDYHPMSSLKDDQGDRERFNECYDTALEFIKNIYLSRNRNPYKKIYCYTTISTDRDNIEKVFWDIQYLVTSTNLKKSS